MPMEQRAAGTTTCAAQQAECQSKRDVYKRQVEVYVIAADKEKKKISLGMKDHSQDPWTVFTSTYQVGDTANVRIVKLMTFGAFAEVVPGVDGLIHISQIADHRIEKPGDVLAEGDKVDVKTVSYTHLNERRNHGDRAVLCGDAGGVDQAYK